MSTAKVRAVTVCVDYSGLLRQSLKYNRHHYDSVMVVTSTSDSATVDVAKSMGCLFHTTDTFYRDGALFNKWAALEEALDRFGRYGPMALVDADVFWPRYADTDVSEGTLVSPLRRMGQTFVSEPKWDRLPLHRNIYEHAGYTQLFHAGDPALALCSCGHPATDHPEEACRCGCPKFAWHQVNWKHAGGADSFFQARWPATRRVQPPWECLHVGEAGVNWGGVGRREELKELLKGRREGRGFTDERL